jgi:transcriptional regulator with XRE-family HTH domain
MTKEKLRSIMDKHKLSQTDIAAITGKTVRQVYSWLSGVHAVPRSLAIILYALDEGKITPANIVVWISRK